jgi:RimJ/RimL family protein N-acetyltransferase
MNRSAPPPRPPLGPVMLSGQVIRLEPLRASHYQGLLEAANDTRIWTWLAMDLSDPQALTRFIDEALAAEAAGREYAFAVVQQDSGRVLGSTRYMDVMAAERGVEIGWTWYHPEAWATRVNPEAKWLLMQHAFETWGAIRVCLKTDELNARSRSAILKLGAQFEGILRQHRIRPDGSYRSSAYYSVLDSEWPLVKVGLERRLQEH